MKLSKKAIYPSLVICISLTFVLGGLSIAADKDIKPPMAIHDKKVPEKDIDIKKQISPRDADVEPMKSDLFVENFEITGSRCDDAQCSLKFIIKVKNQGIATRESLTSQGFSGAVFYRIDWRSDNSRMTQPKNWNHFRTRGGWPLRTRDYIIFDCVEVVPKGSARLYRVIVDPSNYIDESNENNNAKIIRYTAVESH